MRIDGSGGQEKDQPITSARTATDSHSPELRFMRSAHSDCRPAQRWSDKRLAGEEQPINPADLIGEPQTRGERGHAADDTNQPAATVPSPRRNDDWKRNAGRDHCHADESAESEHEKIGGCPSRVVD